MKFSRVPLAAALASVFMTVAPSLAQGPKVVAKPSASDPKIVQLSEKPADDKPTLLRQSSDYSKENAVVTIAIMKGKKDDITGEEIGDSLAAIMKQKFDVPSKYFVSPGADYTAIVYFVKGHAYGPYGLKESIGATALAADDFDERVRPNASSYHSPASGFAAKPAPER